LVTKTSAATVNRRVASPNLKQLLGRNRAGALALLLTHKSSHSRYIADRSGNPGWAQGARSFSSSHPRHKDHTGQVLWKFSRRLSREIYRAGISLPQYVKIRISCGLQRLIT